MAILVAAATADVAAAIRQRVTIRLSYGYSHYDWGDCGASCTDGNSANMNANVATAISRATDG